MAKDLEQDGRLAALEARLAAVTTSLRTLEGQQQRQMEAPAWAQAAAAYYAPFYDTPTGSYDFWRLLTIMHRIQTRGQQTPGS